MTSPSKGRPLLLLSQVYPPDPTALGQHLHDLARTLARRGHRVRVLTSARGFADTSHRYPRREVRDGVEIVRLAGAAFGKSSLTRRSASGLLFLAQALLRALLGPRPSAVLASTSPPMAPLFGRWIAGLRRAPLVLWLMDLNPDQAIATGAVARGAVAARLLEWGNRTAARASERVIVLDRYMAERVSRRWVDPARLVVSPPWALEDHVAPIPHAENPFRQRHAAGGQRVVMYSGNLSPVHPLDTILQAAREIRDDPRLLFLFVGGGGQRAAIERAMREEGLANVRVLPYQALEDLRYSLSAADVHLVSMGATMVGVVHPSKVYGAMAAARPILYLGPRRSHIGELVDRLGIGWHIEHGDVTGAVTTLRQLADLPDETLVEYGQRARRALAGELSQETSTTFLCDLLEKSVSSGRSR